MSMSTGLEKQVFVPFVDLKTQFKNLQPAINAAFQPVFESTSFILGPQVAEFESAFADYVGAKYCITVHSGTAALHIALLAAGIGPGDEVITVPNTFIATVEAIHFAGATPVFVDVDRRTYNMDPALIERAITPKTRAIMPVHLYGQPCDMEPIQKIAREHGLKLIEDCAQAHGAKYEGKNAGTFGEIGCFSFYPGKNLGAAGEGGAIVTDDEEVARICKLYRDHGSSKKYHHDIVGHNFRLDTLQAVVLNIKLPYLDSWNEGRRRAARYYSENLANVEGLVVPFVPDGVEPVFHLYVVQVRDREKVQAKLDEANIQSGIHYPVPVHLQPAFQHMNLGPGSFPVSEELGPSILSLPMYPELTEELQDHVIRTLKEALS